MTHLVLSVSTELRRFAPTRLSYLPRLPGQHLPRPMLLDALGQWSPVTVVRGATGFGKTTLVAGWLDGEVSPDVVPIWITADATVAELPGFARRLREMFVDSGLLAGRMPDLTDADPAAIFAQLHALLRGTAPGRRIVLVIDRIDHVHDRVLLEELVRLVQAHRCLHLVVCSLGYHVIETLAAAAVDVAVVGQEQLELGPAEIEDLSQRMGNPFTSDEAQEVYRALGGWIAPVRIVIAARVPGERPPLWLGLQYGALRQVTLTKQERVVLDVLDRDLSRPDMARELHLSLNTVKTHLASLYRKLGTSSRTATLSEARRLGLL